MGKNLNQYIFSVLVALIMATASGGGQTAFSQTNDAVQARQAQLQSELEEIERQITAQQQILTEKQKESASLARDVAILNAQIAEAKLKIKSHAIQIQQLGKAIDGKTKTIGDLETRISQGHESLADLIRKTNQIDSLSVVDVALSNKDLSEFFADLDSFDSIRRSLQDTFNEIRDVKSKTETEKTNLTIQQNKEIDLKAATEAEKRTVEKAEAQKKVLLSLTKNQEKTYQAVLAERQKKAAQIRSALFALRDTAAIPFGTALNYANLAYAKTNVRPAFLLAILTQETNLGENIGTCNRPGDPPSKSWREIMKPERDIEPFKRITSALGFDPDSMPVSCPWKGGWGGAMGPSQFIPSTWEIYDNKIQSALGLSTYPNPWDPKTAFMASALYLSELGAGNGGYTAERTAALKYYAGSNWAKPANAFYGNQVMAKAESIQENMIDPLQNL